jgi:hypothetical protein
VGNKELVMENERLVGIILEIQDLVLQHGNLEPFWKGRFIGQAKEIIDEFSIPRQKTPEEQDLEYTKMAECLDAMIDKGEINGTLMIPGAVASKMKKRG